MAMMLNTRSCPPHGRDTAGWTPLHLAAHRLGRGTDGCNCKRCLRLQKRQRQCMRLLLEHGASADEPDDRQATAAHLAAAHDDTVGLRLLRAYGANLWIGDEDGETPLRIARRYHKPSRFVRTLLLLSDGGASREPEGEPLVPVGEDG